MRFLLPVVLGALAACTSRAGTDRTTTDMGVTPLDAGAHDGSVPDAPASDAAPVDGSAVDAGGTDAATHDAGSDAGGEPCGTSVCTTGSYCCAPACNLCLSDSMFCLTDPCAGIDAGPPPVDGGAAHDAGIDEGTMTGDCRSTGCSSTLERCMLCRGIYECLPSTIACAPVPVP